MSEVEISSALAGQAPSLPKESGIESRTTSSLRLVQHIRFTCMVESHKCCCKGTMSMSIRSAIINQFELVAKDQKQRLPTLSDELVLLESGLDSLFFAVIVARLEDELGFDPFSASEEVEFPVTFSDFVRIYESSAP